MPRPSVTSVLAGLALAVALAGVAQGAIPGSDGRIRGCYDADPAGAGGVLKDLYVVDERDGCPAGTRELLWNQTGVAGPAGPAGATGAQGRPEDPHASYRTDVRFVQDEGTPDYRKGGWVRVDCNPDETAIGGGAEVGQPRANLNAYALVASRPVHKERGWAVLVVHLGVFQPYRQAAAPLTVTAWAVCARTLVTANPTLPASTGVAFGPRP